MSKLRKEQAESELNASPEILAKWRKELLLDCPALMTYVDYFEGNLTTMADLYSWLLNPERRKIEHIANTSISKLKAILLVAIREAIESDESFDQEEECFGSPGLTKEAQQTAKDIRQKWSPKEAAQRSGKLSAEQSHWTVTKVHGYFGEMNGQDYSNIND